MHPFKYLCLCIQAQSANVLSSVTIKYSSPVYWRAKTVPLLATYYSSMVLQPTLHEVLSVLRVLTWAQSSHEPVEVLEWLSISHSHYHLCSYTNHACQYGRSLRNPFGNSGYTTGPSLLIESTDYDFVYTTYHTHNRIAMYFCTEHLALQCFHSLL